MAAEISGDLTRLTAAQIAGAIADGQVSAVEVTRAHLDRIAAVDPDVHAFLHVAPELAVAAAAEVDRKRAAGEPLGPLAGVPLALKDVLTTADMPTTCGSKILEGWRPPYDATVTQRLRDGGRHPAGQDQHGRVRDGLLHRELRLRRLAQPLGSEPDPRRLIRRVAARPSPRTRRRSGSAPTPAARSASPPRSAGSSA